MPRKPKTKPTKKPSAKKPAKAKRRTRPTNNNTVRVHVVNSIGGETAPPPYTGPDRGYFAFNPVFDVGTPKQAMPPPMNAGLSIASGPVRRVTEAGAQTENGGIYDRFVESQNPTVSTGTGVPLGAPGASMAPGVSKVDRGTDPFPSSDELKRQARSLGVKGYGGMSKGDLWQAIQKRRQEKQD